MSLACGNGCYLRRLSAAVLSNDCEQGGQSHPQSLIGLGTRRAGSSRCVSLACGNGCYLRRLSAAVLRLSNDCEQGGQSHPQKSLIYRYRAGHETSRLEPLVATVKCRRYPECEDLQDTLHSHPN